MKLLFPGHYKPTGEELEIIWKNCLFVLDTNVLLNLYRYTPSTSALLLDILEQVRDRIWLPYQVAKEYQKNRLEVIAQQQDAYKEIDEFLQKTRNQIQGKLGSFSRHPYIEIDKIMEDVSRTFESVSQSLQTFKKSHPNLIQEDNIRARITSLFEGKVGSIYKDERLKALYKEGEERYKTRIAPGYMDSTEKDGEEKYGDLIIWYQIIDKAQEENRSIIFLTDDSKEDWWWKFRGKIIGPNTQLIDEFQEKVGLLFYMYRSDQFMDHAQKFLNRSDNQQAIAEVRDIRQLDDLVSNRKQSLVSELQQLDLDYQELSKEVDRLHDFVSLTKDEIALYSKLYGENPQDPNFPKLLDRQRILLEVLPRLDSLIAVREETRRKIERNIDELSHLNEQTNVIQDLLREKYRE